MSVVHLRRRVENFIINAASNGQRQVQQYDPRTGIPTSTRTVGSGTFLRVLVMNLISHILFIYDSTWCKRCIYYIWLIIFCEIGKKTTFYATLVLVASLNGVPRLSIPFSSKGNGTLAGTVTITKEGNRINLRSLDGIEAKDDFQRQVQGIADLGLKLVEVGGIPAPDDPNDLSPAQVAFLSKTVFLIVEKQGVFSDLLRNGLLQQGYPVIILETAGCAATYHLGILAWFKLALMTVYGVELTIVLGCADNAPSGFNVLSNCWEKFSEVWAENELHVAVDCLGPFHCHESEFPGLQGGLRADITDNERQVINQLRHSEHFVNNPQRLAILDSFIEKGYTRQLEFYGRVPLVLWLFKEIKRRVENVDIDIDMMDTS